MAEDAPPSTEGDVGEILFLLTAPHPDGMGLGANGLAPETRLKERFLGTGDWKEADYDPAMQKIIEQGWVKRVSDRIRLTENGHNISQVSSRSINPRS
jgi:hypothetical protein